MANANVPSEGIGGNLLTNLLDLSADMKFLLQSTLMSDVVLCVSEKYMFYCHKDILKFRSKWFSVAIDEATAKGENRISFEEDIRIIEAVLCYIYTGDLRLMESLNVCLVDVHEAAKKYGFIRLRKICGKMIQELGYREVTKCTEFLWTVNVDECNSYNAECPALNDFTVCGNDRWQLKMKTLDSTSEDGGNIGIYLTRHTEEPRTTIHNVRLTISVIDCSGKSRYSFFNQNVIVEDGDYFLGEGIPVDKLKQEDLFLSDGTLTLSCELTFLARVNFLSKFRLGTSFQKYYPNELIHLSDDMYKVLVDSNTQDFEFALSDVKVHSYILVVRSRIPPNCVAKLEERVVFRKQTWLSFALFLYTGQCRYLEEHGRDVYLALCSMPFTMARQKYSTYLAKNLTLENAVYFLNDAVSCKDDNLISAAADFLSRHSTIISDPQKWISLANDKTELLNLIPQLCIFKQFL